MSTRARNGRYLTWRQSVVVLLNALALRGATTVAP